MNLKNPLVSIAAVAVISLIAANHLQRSGTQQNVDTVSTETRVEPELRVAPEGRVAQTSPQTTDQNSSALVRSSVPIPSGESQTREINRLTVGNFESLVSRCFKGEMCELDEDPWALYQRFRTLGNDNAADNLISFLRSQLRDPQFQERYKIVLKKMINDFYPSQEKQFQEAAYYNYLGDLEKSLDLYLDLERKSQNNSVLRHAPKLNIANTFYDLKRYNEAIPYYEAALNEFISQSENGSVPSRNAMIKIIQERLEELKGKLN